MNFEAQDFFDLCDEERKAFYEECYYDCKMSWKNIADTVVSYPNRVRRDAKKLGIQSRSKSEAQKVALDEGRNEHPTKGKRHSAETKKKISSSQGQVWDNLTEEEKALRSQIGLESWNKKTPTERLEFFKKSTEAIQKASKEGSKLENYLFKLLIEKGYRVDKHKEHILKREKLHIDLYIPSCRTAVEVDGPMHFEPVFGEDKLQRRQEADNAKTGLILSSGMVLIRVKLNKRQSQRYFRDVGKNLLTLLDKIQKSFPDKEERYFEI